MSVSAGGISIESPVLDIFGNSEDPLLKPTGADTAFTNLEDIQIDSQPPTSTISDVDFDVTSGTFTITGANFNTIDRPDSNDVLSQLDWSKFVWDIDNDGTTSNDFAFTAESFVAYDDNGTASDASDDTGGAIVDTSQGDTHTITAKLTTAAFDALKAADGLGFDGYDADRTDATESANRADAIDISAGFIVDDSGNAATTDAVSVTSIGYSDTDGPTIAKLYSTTDDTVADNDPSDSNPASYGLGQSFNVTAEMSEEVLAGSSITVAFSTGGSATLTAAENGLYMTGTYTVLAGQSTDVSGLSVSAGGISIESPVLDIFGNSEDPLLKPTGADTAFTNLEDIQIDSQPPTSTISDVDFDVTSGTFTITGANFNTIDRPDSNDVLSQLDWSKFVWDIDNDGDTSNDFAFTAESLLHMMIMERHLMHLMIPVVRLLIPARVIRIRLQPS